MHYSLIIGANTSTGVLSSSMTRVIISLDDINDHAPVFYNESEDGAIVDSYVFDVSASTPVDTRIGKVCFTCGVLS